MSRAGVLVENWRAVSLTSAWSDSAEWWTPAVDALADALAGRPVADTLAAGATLGRQRAAAGVFLDEARADVLVAARLAGLRHADSTDLVDALTVGWVDRMLDAFFTGECLDPLTELTSLPYLMTRMAEIYAEAELRGVAVPDEHALVVVRPSAVAGALEAETQMIVVQTAMRTAFRGGETLARVAPSCAVALVPRGEPRLSDCLARLSAELDIARTEGRLHRPRMWLERLPYVREDLPALLRQLDA